MYWHCYKNTSSI